VLKTAKPILFKLRTGLTVSVLAMALSACGTTNWGFPYRADVQQGNWITAEQVSQLQKGMTREQVRFILGTPTLQDVFRSNRWDYPYFNKPGYGKVEERKFTVWFEGDALDHWEGDTQPDRQPFQKSDTGKKAGPTGASPASAADQAGAPSTPVPPPESKIEVRPVSPGAAGGSSSPAAPQPLR
jgi:outer membrane protein assembly factor BamE